MSSIIPAIIPKSYNDLKEKLQIVAGAVDFVHIDVTDGSMGGKASWPIEGDKGDWANILNQEVGLPLWEDIDYEVHFMTEDPLTYVKDWVEAGATRVILQVESLDYERDIQFLDQLKSEGLVEIGIAIKADTNIEELDNYYHIADFIQAMTIAKIGAQGAEFDKKGLDNISEIFKKVPTMVISVDGAMNPETAGYAIESGAERIVVGSYIFKSVNPLEAIEEMKSLI